MCFVWSVLRRFSVPAILDSFLFNWTPVNKESPAMKTSTRPHEQRHSTPYMRPPFLSHIPYHWQRLTTATIPIQGAGAQYNLGHGHWGHKWDWMLVKSSSSYCKLAQSLLASLADFLLLHMTRLGTNWVQWSAVFDTRKTLQGLERLRGPIASNDHSKTRVGMVEDKSDVMKEADPFYLCPQGVNSE